MLVSPSPPPLGAKIKGNGRVRASAAVGGLSPNPAYDAAEEQLVKEAEQLGANAVYSLQSHPTLDSKRDMWVVFLVGTPVVVEN